MPTVVILGSSYTGLKVAHKLLKYTTKTVKDLKVILVNPSTHFYWNMASVRAIVPDLINDKELFQEIAPAFKYAGDSFEFVNGSAEHVDVTANTVSVNTPSGLRTLSYDQLVVATGSRTNEKTAFKAGGTYQEMLDQLHLIQKSVADAKSIVIGGGGTTGVEVAGELGSSYGGKKEITIITAGEIIMKGNMTTAINLAAQKEIQKLKVKIVHNTRVQSSSTMANGQTELVLSDGKKVITDLYLPTTGLRANTSFLDKKFLDSAGDADVNANLMIKGTKNVWAAGDVSNLERSGWMITGNQAEHVIKGLELAFKGKDVPDYKIPADGVAVALGRKKGTGHAFGFKLPSIIVYYAKVKTLGLDKVAATVSGSMF